MLDRRYVLGASLALLFAQAGGQSVAAAAEADAWASLRAGAVALFRHADAPGTGDPAGFRLGDCSTQRNLGEQGRRQAARIGDRFRAERVLVAVVLSSQWCRATETAELAFPGKVQQEPAFNSFFDDRSEGPAMTSRGRAILEAWRGPGTLVVTTHQVNITALTGIVPAEGEGIILRASPGALSVIGRIRP